MRTSNDRNSLWLLAAWTAATVGCGGAETAGPRHASVAREVPPAPGAEAEAHVPVPEQSEPARMSPAAAAQAEAGSATGGSVTPASVSVPADVAAPPADSQRTPTGLASRVLQPGVGGAHPGPESKVTVHYSGWTTDGDLFDSSVARGEPLAFKLGQVIPGFREGIQLMVVGEKRRLWIPEKLAYQGKPNAPKGMLVFDVELIGID